jgi:high-affinity iron transporter
MGRKRDKWRGKLASTTSHSQLLGGGSDGDGDGDGKVGGKGVLAGIKRVTSRYAMFVLPFVTVLREGIEAVVFIAGVSFSAPATAVPLPVVVGIGAGVVVGWGLYK